MFQPVRPRLEHLNPLVSLRCSNRSNLLTSFEDLIKEGSSRGMARSTPVFLLPKQKVGTGWNRLERWNTPPGPVTHPTD
jgi:hypothetical protein